MFARAIGWFCVLLGTATAAEFPLAPVFVAGAGAAMVTPAGRDAVLDIQISLPLRNEAGLDALLADLRNPASPRYRHYLSPAAFTAAFGPSQSDYDAVAAFVRASGLAATTTPNRRLIDVTGSIGRIEQALHIKLGFYRDTAANRLFLAPDRQPALDLAVPVLTITGLDSFVPPRSHLVRGAPLGAASVRPHTTGSGPGGQFIGSDMRAAYYGRTLLTGAGQSVGLLELGGYNIADVQNYFATLGQPLDVAVTGVSVAGASLDCSGGCDDSEQVLDIEEAISMAPGMNTVFVYVGNSPLLILNRMATDDAALQLSSSWGWSPDQAADEPVFKQYIAQGQSFVDATGDYGYLLKLDAVWPADDAYVTAVGGTDLVTAGPGGKWRSETGWRFSGGGPSPDGIALPAYQAPFVTAANHASTTRRNVPDVAAEADTDNFSCYDGGCAGGNGGTSYAAPRWAGFIAFANEQAAREGQPPVGFVNSPVYRVGAQPQAYAATLHDQTAGFNGRYSNVAGFDLVTGFGSMSGQATIDLLAGQK